MITKEPAGYAAYERVRVGRPERWVGGNCLIFMTEEISPALCKLTLKIRSVLQFDAGVKQSSLFDLPARRVYKYRQGCGYHKSKGRFIRDIVA